MGDTPFVWSLPARGSFLRAAAPGYSVFRKIVVPPEPGGEIVIDFKMKPALIVQGIVVDEQDRPIEGARIRTFFTIFYKYVPTDAQGRFELDYLERGRSSHTLFARKEGYLEASTQVQADAPKPSYKLVLKRGVRCEGRITAPSGRGIAGARLYIGRDPASYDRLDAVSDEDGHFVFPTVKPGEHDLVTQAQGYASDVRKWKVDAKPGEVSRIVVRLDTGRIVAGIIVDKKGKVMAGVGVHARVHRAGASLFRRGRYIGERTRTDAEGRFRLLDMAKGKIDVECYGDGVIRHVEEGVSTDIKDLRIVLSRAAQLAGKVVDANTGRCEIIASLECKDPLPESMSVIMRFKTRKPGAAAPAANKVYYAKSVGTKIHIKGLPAGDYDVWVRTKSLMGIAKLTLTEKSPSRVKIKVRRKVFQR